MTPKERIFSAIAGQPVDRRPVIAVLSLYGAKLTSCSLARYHREAKAYGEGQAAVFHRFEPDLIFGPFTLAKEAAAFGAVLRTYEDQPPIVRHPAFATPAELTRRPPPPVEDSEELAFIRDANAETVRRMGDEVPVAAVINSPIDLPALLLGLDTWLETLLCDEGAAREVLVYTSSFVSAWANTLLQTGAALVIFPLDACHPGFTPLRVSERLLYPALKACLADVRGAAVLHHGGLPMLPVLSGIRGMANVVGYVADPADRLDEMRCAIGEGAALIGNLLAPTLFTLKPAEIRRRARAILEERRHDARFILGTSGPDVALRTEPEQVQALRGAAEDAAAGILA